MKIKGTMKLNIQEAVDDGLNGLSLESLGDEGTTDFDFIINDISGADDIEVTFELDVTRVGGKNVSLEHVTDAIMEQLADLVEVTAEVEL